MIKSIRTIGMLILLISCAIQAQAQLPMPEQACVGTTHHYWVEGLPGSVYTWKVDGVIQSSTSNEIDILWSNSGTFTLEVQEHQGECDGDVRTGLITVTDLAIPEFSIANEYCTGSLIAALPTVSNNGITGSWTPGINNSETTTYTFTPDDEQCAIPVEFTITITDGILPTFEAIAAICSGSPAISLPATSQNNITGSWSPAFNNTATTEYTFTPDPDQCASPTTLTVVVNNEIIPTFAQVGPYCAGSAIADLPTTSTNGITGTWAPAIDNTQTTEYTFTPDAGQCGVSTTLTITISDEIIPEFAQVGPYCAGSAIADLPTTSTNGITGSWAPAIDNTQATEYTFTPDPGQCGTTTTLTITISDEIIPVFASVGPFCAGTTIADLPTTSTNGITGSWSPAIDNTQTTEYTFTPDAGQCGVSTTLTITISDEIIPTFAGVGPYCAGSVIAALPTTSMNSITGTWSPAIDNTQTTEYTFTPDAGQCGTTTTLTITISDEIIPVFASVGPYCADAAIAALPTTSTNGITGTWSPAIDNTQSTEYTFTPNANQCAVPTTLTITISDEIIPTFAQVGPYCAGSAIAALPTTSTNGITGSWSPAIDNTQTTEYAFTPDAGQCGTTTTLTITISDEIIPVFASVGPFCAGTTIAALPTTSTNGITGTWSPAINNQTTTTYTFTPDANQCGVSTTLTIAINESITPTFDPVGPYNPGSVIAALPTVSNNGISGSWSPAIDNTVTTTYTFTSDAGQCAGTATLTIVINQEVITPIFDPIGPLCRGTAFTLPSVSNNGITGTWNPAINNTQTTTYTFTPDAGQGAEVALLTVEITDQITPAFAQVGPFCAGTAIADLPTTSTNGITGTWAPAIDNTQTTEYTFTPDAGQCAVPTTLTITISDEIIPAFAGVGPYCAGTAIAALPTTSTNGITGTWSPAIDNTQTTEYTFTPDENQCGVSTTLTITISDEITPAFAQVGPFCQGEAIAELPTISDNGITGSWSPDIDNTQTTEYTFTPDENQCGVSTTLTITISDGITPAFAQMGPFCQGEAIADLPTTSDNGITGSWSPAIDNTQTTEYTFTPDPGQCGSITTMTIDISNEITPTFDPVSPVCIGGAILLPGISKEGIPGTWSPAIDNTQTTTYIFTPIGVQCAVSGSLTVEVTESITPTFDAVGPYCLGSDIPALPTISNNGISGSWNPAIDNTQTTVYTFTPEAGQCGETTQLTLTIEESIMPLFEAVGPYCVGSDIATLPTTSNNNITGSWSPVIDNTLTTTYTFTPDDGQCGASTTLTIVIQPQVIPSFDPVASYCQGSDIPALPTTSNNGIHGSWSPAIDNTHTTTYTFTPDGDQCALTSSMTIVIDQQIVPAFDPVGPYCPGSAIAALPTTSNNGISGSWSPEIDNSQTTTYTFTPDGDECASTTSMTIVIDQNITPTFDPMGPFCPGTAIAALPPVSREGIAGTWSPEINNTETTTYSFTPNEGQCGSTATLTIAIEENIRPTFDAVGPFCIGADFTLPAVSREGIAGQWSPDINNTATTTYTFTPQGGDCSEVATLTIEIQNIGIPEFTAVRTYCAGEAIPELPTVSNNGITGSWSPAINNTATTTYIFTPDNECASTATLTIAIEENILPGFDAVGPYCQGDDIGALPTVSNNGITGSWSPSIDNSQTTTYLFTPDGTQCATTVSLTIVIEQGTTPLFNPVGSYCYGTQIAALPTTSNNGITGSWSPEINHTATTTYTFTPDTGQCATEATATITITDLIIPTFDPVTPVCSGASVTLPAVSTNGIRGSWSPVIDNTQTTTYIFTPEEGQCSETASLTIEVQESIIPTFEPIGAICRGADITLPSVSTNGITGSWNPAIDNTQTTLYTFTPDAGQCAISATLTIEVGESITPVFTAVGPYCSGSAIEDLPTVSNNGISGSWSPAIDNTHTTVYTFTPDDNQCGTTTTLTITISDEIILTFDPLGPVCSGQTITLPARSREGIPGTWSPAVDNTRTTTYTFTPEDSQCVLSTTLTVEVLENITPAFDPAGPFCIGAIIAELPTVSNNGISGSWSPTIDNTQTTTYTFTPDPDQCATTATLTINIADEITPTFDPVGPYCEGSVIAALPTVSNNGISGSWSPAIDNSQTTTYTFTPDADQCGTTTTLIIGIEDEVIPTFDPVGPFNPGSVIAALPTVSNNGITGSWSPAIDNTQTTTYTFTPDPDQCATTATLTITILDEIIPVFDPVGPFCEGEEIAALPTVSNNGITGSWSPAIDNTQTTTYTFTPEDGQGAAVASLTITITEKVIPAFDPVGPYNPGSVIAALPTVSNNGIQGTWSPVIDNTQTTTYTFTPDDGQCATQATLTITISDLVIPTFDPVGPYCEGSAIAALPTVSNNGITGTWSPAIDNTQTTTYTFTPEDGQGGAITTLVIQIEDEVIPTFDPVGPYCVGSVITALPNVSNNGIQGTWSPAVNNTQTTTYTFIPDDNQCATTATLTITIDNEITPTFDPVRSYCVGSAIEALPTVSNNGIRGTWSPAIDNTQTTTYTFTPEAGQCALPAMLTISVGTEIIPDFTLIGPYCPGTVLNDLPRTSRNGVSGTWSPVMNNMVTTQYRFTPHEGQCAVATTLVCEIGTEITPTFEPVGPYCVGTNIAALPTVSLNGVAGTWSPAIDNTKTTTYTFTPEEGLCALPVELTIVISDKTIPDFASVAPYCIGETIADLPTTSLNGITGTWSPAINNTQTTTYTFTPDADQCAVTTSMVIEVENNITPTFDAMDPVCAGSVIAALPTVSNNLIRGAWSPAINNRQTTTYTFTPNPGQCAATATMVIEVNENIVPTFDVIGPYCPGAVISALPVISNNGIRGSWSPAINNKRTTTYTFTPNAGQCALSTSLTIVIENSVVPLFNPVGPYCPGSVIAALPVTSTNGITGTWSPAINNTRTTTYTFTPDSGQCAIATTLTVIVNPVPVTPVVRAIQPNCTVPSGTVEIISPQGQQYQYRLDGGNYQSEPLFTGLAPESSHTITVRDITSGCESLPADVRINSMPQNPGIPVAELTVKPTCAGDGVVVVTQPIGSEYEYSMDGGPYQAMPVFYDVAWGEHSIRVRNSVNGCESGALIIEIPAVIDDMDHDGVADALDPDTDGDGILNIHEGALADDNDGDDRMNYMDIDADGDGIVDNFEAQTTDDYILPSYEDEDQNGVDDVYDQARGGIEIIPVDSDKDGLPDFLDLDAENDKVPDYIEGHDQDANGKPDHFALGKDSDADGLDDGYDAVVNDCLAKDNATGTNASIQDFDGDGLRDWRDKNDDDDEYLTEFEDLNADNDYSNDDIDYDGSPEYLDYGRECDLFIPDAFSPNGDNVHDYYQVYCINHYPNAKLYIFDQLGNKIYEKTHYGNLQVWGSHDAAWWNGKPTRGPGYSRNNLVPPGTYYYVLDLGNGEVKKSYVFVSY